VIEHRALNARPGAHIDADLLAGDASQQIGRGCEDADEAIASLSALHPRLQTPMRLIDHLFFIAEHDDHHLAKIGMLLRET